MSSDAQSALSASQLGILRAAADNRERRPDRYGRGSVIVGRGQGVAARILERRELGVVRPEKHATLFVINDAGLQAVRDAA